MKRAVVVGAGVGGLTAAMRLAHEGFEVELFEKQPGPGGRCGQVTVGDYRFDLGPTILLMPHVLRDTFAAVGRELADYLKITRCDPHYRLHFADGRSFTMQRDGARMREELERIEPGSHVRFAEFLRDGRQKHDVAFEHFVTRHFDSVLEFVAPRRVPPLVKSGALTSLQTHVGRYFQSEALQQAFSFQTMYLGLSPASAPSVFSLLPYTEAEHGIWFPQGGMFGIAKALERVCVEEGVDLRYSTPVRRVLVEKGQAAGVELADGRVVRADVVVCNADYAWASANLLPKELAAARTARVQRQRFTSSGLMFYWGLSKRADALLHHNVFFGRDFAGSFDDIFERGRVPADPSFYVNAPARTSAGFAPEGHDALYVLVPAPADPSGVDWAAETKRVKAQVLARLVKEGIGELDIVAERVITPADWQSGLNLERGANFGLAQNLFQLGPFRPKVTDAEVEGLYWCGASIQPGTGVPTVMLSAGFAVEKVLERHGRGAKRDEAA
ncbi:MAG: phytoene desaturase [Myxococcaceae bacterium]|nr:phytoene desaturase [Myxococcaceae bacterium]